jgi:hypothetical protein
MKSRRKRGEGYAANMGDRRNAYKISVRKTEWKRTFERPRHRFSWVQNRVQ